MKKQQLIVIVAAVIVLGAFLAIYLSSKPIPTPAIPALYTYKVVNVFPHDTTAFTQGLVFENGFLFESTGLYGNSTLRKVELETGRALQLHQLPAEFFGEGITIIGDKVFQLTWQSQKGFIYDKRSFELIGEFNYPTEGWGITNDGTRLIMSDGSSTLSFLDPKTLKITGQIQVHDANTPVTRLNELEYIKGDVYANIWQEDRIAIIDIQTGQVKAWIDLTGLYISNSFDADNVLNGIAYDADKDRLFVTGKRWSKLFEIKILPT